MCVCIRTHGRGGGMVGLENKDNTEFARCNAGNHFRFLIDLILNLFLAMDIRNLLLFPFSPLPPHSVMIGPGPTVQEVGVSWLMPRPFPFPALLPRVGIAAGALASFHTTLQYLRSSTELSLNNCLIRIPIVSFPFWASFWLSVMGQHLAFP